MSLEDQVSNLVTAINKMVGGNSGPAPAQGGAGGAQQSIGFIANAGEQIGKLAKETVPLVAGFYRLTQGSDVTALALDKFSKGLSEAGLSKFGGLVGEMGGEFLKQKNNLDALNKETGAAGLNIGRYVRMAGEAGVTTAQFNDLIKNSNGSLMGLGLNSSHSAEVFSKVNRQLIESDIGGKLMQAGISSEDMAKYTAISITGMRRRDLTTAEGQALVQKSAASFSQSLLEASAMTGQNRDAMAGNIKAQLETTDNTLAMANMSAKERASYQALTEQVGTLSPALADTVSEMYNNNGVISEKAIAMTSMMGPAGIALQDHVAQFKAASQAGNAAEVDRLKKEIEMDNAKGLKYQADMQKSGQTSQTMDPAMAAAQNEYIQKQKGYFLNLTAALEDSGGNMELALEKMKTDAKYQTQGKTSTGADDAGARVAMAMNEANHRATITAGGMSQAFEKSSDMIGSNNIVIGVMKDGLDIIGRPGGKMDQAADKFMQFPEKLKDGLKSIASGGTNTPTSHPTTGIDAAGNIVPKKGKASGGGINADEEYIVGEEGPEKIKLAKPGVVTPNKEINSGINLAEISKTISTTISSSTGGSTTTSRVQNDDSKKAEKELQTTKEQYAAERQALLEKTRAAMGPEASRRDVRQAINTSDEGKALEEKYKTAMDPLYKRIDAGISYETTRKQEAVEETKKTVDESIRITKNGHLAITAATKDGSEVTTFIKKNEIAETLKQAELQKSVLGKNVKDMSDDMIESMIPKGTKIEDYYIDMNNNLQSWANDSAKYMQEKAESSKTIVTEIHSKILENEKITNNGVVSAKTLLAEVTKKSFTDELIEKDKANQQNIGKVKEFTTAELIERDKANMQNIGKVKEQSINPIEQLFGNFAKIGDKIAPEIKKQETSAASVASKQADLKKAPDQSDAETKRLASASVAAKAKTDDSKSTTTGKTTTQEASLKDLNDQLVQLNKQMVQLLTYNAQISDHTQTTARTKPAGQR